MENRERGQLFEEHAREYWVVPLEALMVLKLREHLHYPADLKYVDDVRKLLTRNRDRLDADELEELLSLDPRWSEEWDAIVEDAP